MRVFAGCLLILASLVPLCAQSHLLGRVLDKVVCEGDASQSYALYVPSGYIADRKWPVIFCFDASARGRMPVERLQGAAEKYGYIIAGSLTSRNGPYAANAAAIRAMVKDVGSHLSLDPQRIYATGVSGGARVATSLGLSGFAKGVIACAAGFPVLEEGIPSRVPFVFFGTAGTEDFNYAELMRLDGELDDRKAVHRIVIFDGGHEWASAALFMEAVEWLELQAMRAGTRPRDDEFIQTLFRTRRDQLPAQPGVERWRALKSFVADFAGLANVGPFESEAKTLGASKDVKDGLKAERILSGREDELVALLGSAAQESVARKEKLAAELRQKAGAPDDSPERRMTRRALASFASMARETGRGVFEQEDYVRAESMLELAVALKPGQSRTLYDLARARAFLGDRKRALESFEQAVSAGFSDFAKAEVEPAFSRFRGDERFQQLLAKVRGNSPEPARATVISSGISEPKTPGAIRSIQPSGDETVQMPAMRVSAALASVELRLFHLPNAGTEVAPLSFLRVETVRTGTAAAEAGIQEGMEITGIQGMRIRGLTEQELSAAMERPVRGEIVVTVREPPRGMEKDIRIPLRRAKEPFTDSSVP